MAVAVDASSPARWAAVNTGPPGSVTSASFTAPTDALLVACVSSDGIGADSDVVTFSDSGGLTWTLHVARTQGETTDGGMASIYTARTTSSVSRTCSFNVSTGSTRRRSIKLYVLTGVDVDGTPVDTVGASNEGGSGTQNLNTTSVTPGATGLLICCDTDWAQQGLFTSSNLTIDTADYAGEISVVSGYRTCTSGVGVSGNLNANRGSPQHKWCQIVVREAAGGGGPDPSPVVPAGDAPILAVWDQLGILGG